MGDNDVHIEDIVAWLNDTFGSVCGLTEWFFERRRGHDPHAVFAFDIGNDALEAEHALGLDASLRWRLPRISGELTFFRNDIDDFIFRGPMDPGAFEARYGVPGDAIHAGGAHDAHGDEGDNGHRELPYFQFTAADALLQGFEAHAEIAVAPSLSVELGCDYVRGEIQSGNEPLPRIPPRRARVALRYRVGAFQAGGEVTSLGAQERVFGPETPTKGAALVRLFTAHSIIAGGAVHTVSARVDNATNHFYRNHLSFLKDIVPEMGRSLRVTYAVHF